MGHENLFFKGQIIDINFIKLEIILEISVLLHLFHKN